MRDLPTIVAAAILHNGKIWSVPRPGRHHDVIHQIFEATGERVLSASTQGFLTSAGEFVNRWRAHRIAVHSGQPCKRKIHEGSELYSEDVW